MPISHIDHITITNDINNTEHATQDSLTNNLSQTSVIDPVTGMERGRDAAHARLSTSVGTKHSALVPLPNPVTSAGEELSILAELEPTATGPLFSAEVCQLLRRVESLRSASVTDGPQVTELQRRVRELGPPEEVLQALQEILRMDNEADADLPEYEEGSQPRGGS
jgi:hypothetical protein